MKANNNNNKNELVWQCYPAMSGLHIGVLHPRVWVKVLRAILRGAPAED